MTPLCLLAWYQKHAISRIGAFFAQLAPDTGSQISNSSFL
jgi:hypothetical protein